MFYAFVLNIVIVLATLFSLWLTRDPLCLLGLWLVREMPFGLLMDDEDKKRPIGFSD